VNERLDSHEQGLEKTRVRPQLSLRQRNEQIAMMAIQDVADTLLVDASSADVTVDQIAKAARVGTATVERVRRCRRRGRKPAGRSSGVRVRVSPRARGI